MEKTNMKKIIAMMVVCSLLLVCTACVQLSTPQTIFSYFPSTSEGNDSFDNNYANDDSTNSDFTEAESYCERLVSQGDFLTAYTYIKVKAEEDPGYNSLLYKYTKIYVDETLKTAENYANNGSYQQAVYILQEANKVYYCSEFTSKIEEYNAYLPCKLSFCKIIDDDDFEYMLDAEDCFGNKYQEVFGFSDSYGSKDGGYAVFYLNGKYSNLAGIFVGSSNLYKDMEVDCKIYGDGKLIYESQKIGRTSPPVNVNLDVTGVEQLRIEYMWYSWYTFEPCCIFDLTAS